MEYLNSKVKFYKKSKEKQNIILDKIKNLYLNTDLCRDEIIKELNMSIGLYKYLLHSLNIKRSKEHDYRVQCRIKKIRYGYENPFQDKENMKMCYLDKLGVDNPYKSKKVREKAKKTKLEKYGDENYNNREKAKQTCIAKYGVIAPIQNKEIKEKIIQTNIERYGVENVFQSKEIKEKITNNNLEKYGVKYSTQRKDIITKRQNTINSKYNIKSISQKHLDKNILNLLYDKNSLKNFIISIPFYKRTQHEISNELNVGYTTIGGFIKNYNLDYLINRKISKYELELQDKLKNFDLDLRFRDRKIIYPLEIDIFISKLNIGIEFNGDYYHSYNKLNNDIRKNDKLYHQQKSLKAQEKGIFIYHIFEYEWNNERKRPIIESQLLNLCHENQNKIYARKCDVKEIKDNNLIREFLNTNHLQGYRQSKIKLGLFYNNELVSIMTFGKPYLSKSNKYEWELYRFCNKLNTSVVGGFDKLFKYFIRNYNPKNILTYSDFAKGDGHTYEKFGFKKLELTIPNYVWINKNEVLTRYQTQMKNEVKIMESNGYDRIFDCGNYKWVWNNE